MKNPFPVPVQPAYDSANPQQWHVSLPGAKTLTRAQVEYAALAINMHERLVDMVEENEWASFDEETGEDGRCPVCKAPVWPDKQHYPYCKLAALLKEAK